MELKICKQLAKVNNKLLHLSSTLENLGSRYYDFKLSKNNVCIKYKARSLE